VNDSGATTHALTTRVYDAMEYLRYDFRKTVSFGMDPSSRPAILTNENDLVRPRVIFSIARISWNGT
jgi:hypothetical protein